MGREICGCFQSISGKTKTQNGDYEGHEAAQRKSISLEFLREPSRPWWLKICGAKDLPFLPVHAVHKAPNAFPQVNHVEVNQQTERFATEFEVRNDLSLMNRRDCIYRFDFHDDEIF